eukprot:245627_1
MTTMDLLMDMDRPLPLGDSGDMDGLAPLGDSGDVPLPEPAEEEDHADELAELISHGIGTAEAPGELILPSLRRLEYLLRRDDPLRRPVACQLGVWQAPQRALVPLFQANSANSEVVLVCVKIFCRLSMPLAPTAQYRSVQLGYLRELKAALLGGDSLTVLMMELQEPLSIPVSERTEMDTDRLELYLTLFKNILAVPNPPSTAHQDSMSFLHDKAIQRFHEEHIMEAAILMAQQIGLEESDTVAVLLMEIFYEFFRLEDAKAATASKTEKSAAVSRLAELNQQSRINLANRRKVLGSRYASTYTMSLMGGTQRISNSVFDGGTELCKDSLKRTVSARRPLPDNPPRKYLNGKVKQAVLEIAELLLDMGYNPLMEAVLDYFKNSKSIDFTSELYNKFSKLCAFLMEVHRIRSRQKCVFELKQKGVSAKERENLIIYSRVNVESTVSMNAFNFIIERLQSMLENREIKFVKINWNAVDHAVRLYKEMVRALEEMSLRGESRDQKHASRVLRGLFEERTPLDIFATLLKEYEAHKSTRSYLGVLVEAVHYVLRMAERLFKSVEGEPSGKIMTKTRSSKRKSKKKGIISEEKEGLSEEKEGLPEEKEGLSEEKEGLSEEKDETKDNEQSHESVETEGNGQVARPNGVSDTQTSVIAVNGILEMGTAESAALRESQIETQLLPNDTPEEPKESAQSGEIVDPRTVELEHGESAERRGDMLENFLVEDGGLDYEAAPMQPFEASAMAITSRKEKELNFLDFFKDFTHNKIIQNYCRLLRSYKTNSAKQNSYIIGFLHRVAVESKMEPALYQISLFSLFDSILNDPSIQKQAKFKPVIAFCAFVVRSFFTRLEKDRLLFLELLFWKPRRLVDSIRDPEAARDARDSARARVQARLDATDGAGGAEFDAAGFWSSDGGEEAEIGDLGKSVRWTSEQDEILREKYPEHKDSPMCSATLAALVQPHSAIQVERRLKKLGLVKRAPRRAGGSKRKNKKKRRPEFREEEVAELCDPSDPRLQSLIRSLVGKLKAHSDGAEALEWLLGKMSMCLRLYDDFPEESVPSALSISPGTASEDCALLPLSARDFTLTRCAPLIRLMRALALREPSRARGEMYWRVPKTYTRTQIAALEDLLNICELEVAPAADGPGPEYEQAALPDPGGAGLESDFDDDAAGLAVSDGPESDRFEVPRTKKPTRKKRKPKPKKKSKPEAFGNDLDDTAFIDDGNDEQEWNPNAWKRKKKKVRRGKKRKETEDGGIVDMEDYAAAESSMPKPKKKRKRLRKQMVSTGYGDSDENGDPNPTSNASKQSSSADLTIGGGPTQSSSSSKRPKKKRRRLHKKSVALDSEDEILGLPVDEHKADEHKSDEHKPGIRPQNAKLSAPQSDPAPRVAPQSNPLPRSAPRLGTFDELEVTLENSDSDEPRPFPSQSRKKRKIGAILESDDEE